MRVATNTIFNTVSNNIARSQERFLKLNEMISSGKRIHQLSTDPPAMTQILRYRSDIASLGQYQYNLDRANSWLTLSETHLTQMEEVLFRAKELAVLQASGTANADSRAAAAVELNILLQQAIEAGNAKIGNQFLFAGRQTNAAPFLPDGTYQGDGGTLDIEIGQGNFITMNTPGNVVFKGAGGGTDVLGVLQALKTALDSNDQSAVQSLLNPLDNSLQQVVNARADVGANMSRLDAQRDKLMEVNAHLEQVLGQTEGVDLAKAISDLTQQQFIYEASLATSARIIQPSLLDFLR